MNSAEVRSLDDNWHTYPDFASTKLPGGITRISREADMFLYKLGYEHDRENHAYKAISANEDKVAFFAHQSFGLAFFPSVLDIPYPMFASHFDINHSAVTVIHFDSGEDGDSSYIIPKVLTFSNDSHIYESRLPTKFQNEFYI